MANETNVIRLKVEGFDAEGRAVPMTGPMLVFLPFSVASHANLVRVNEALPEESLVVAVESEVVGAVPWSEVPDEVITTEALRRWGQSLRRGGPPELLAKGLHDICVEVKRAAVALKIDMRPENHMVDIAGRVADRAEACLATWDPNEKTALLDAESLADVRGALEMALDHVPPLAIIRGWTPEERETAKVWGWDWFEWAGAGSEGEAPTQPECLARALDFLANGTIKLGGAS